MNLASQNLWLPDHLKCKPNLRDWVLSHSQLTVTSRHSTLNFSLTSPKYTSPILVRVLVRVVGSVGSEHWNILVSCLDSLHGTPQSSCECHDIEERGFVYECVLTIRDTMSVNWNVSGCRLTSERKPMEVIPGCVLFFLGPIHHQPPPVSVRK